MSQQLHGTSPSCLQGVGVQSIDGYSAVGVLQHSRRELHREANVFVYNITFSYYVPVETHECVVAAAVRPAVLGCIFRRNSARIP